MLGTSVSPAATIAAWPVVAAALGFLPITMIVAVVMHTVLGTRVGREGGHLRRGDTLPGHLSGQGAASWVGLGDNDIALHWIENPVREQFHAVSRKEPHQRIAPHEQCPTPPEGWHEDPVHRKQSRQRLRAGHRQ